MTTPLHHMILLSMKAFCLHENSYVPGVKMEGRDFPLGGSYAIPMDEACFQVASDQNEATYVMLSADWGNDIEEIGLNIGLKYEHRLNDEVVDIEEFRKLTIDEARQRGHPQIIVREMTADEVTERQAQLAKWKAECDAELADLSEGPVSD